MNIFDKSILRFKFTDHLQAEVIRKIWVHFHCSRNEN